MNQQRKGMKLLKIWVPDSRSVEFQEEVKRQSALLRQAPEETEALDFIEQATDWEAS